MNAPSPQHDPTHPATTRGAGRPASDAFEPEGNVAGQGHAEAKYGHERLTPVPVSGRSGRRRGRGPGRTGLVELVEQLSGRDIAVLDLIADHRFLTSRHVERFCFHDHASAVTGARSARRVLARLERDRLIERPIRRVGGLMAGSASSIWMLTSVGQRLRSMRAGNGAVGRVRAPGERFIAHYLAIADARLALVEAARRSQLVLTRLQLEPSCWHRYTGLGGSREILKPDLAAVTATSHDADYEDHWFIEIDRGTESLPTLIRQCRAYEAFRHTGQLQLDGGVFPVVVWVVPDQIRADKLRATIRASRGLDAALYRITTPDGLVDLIAGGAG